MSDQAVNELDEQEREALLQYIAQTILNQINSLDPTLLKAFGARDFVVLKEGDRTGGFQLGGVSFYINAGTLDGSLTTIRLMDNDTYTVELFDSERSVVGRQTELYWEQLPASINDLVEAERSKLRATIKPTEQQEESSHANKP